MGSYLANELSVLQGLIEQLSKIFQDLPQAGDYYKKLETSAGQISDEGLSNVESSPLDHTKPGTAIRILTSGVVTMFLRFVPFFATSHLPIKWRSFQ